MLQWMAVLSTIAEAIVVNLGPRGGKGKEKRGGGILRREVIPHMEP